jgi:hypothetical protein
MGRPIKKRRGDKPPKSINLKSPDVLERLRARTATTALGYTDVVRRALDALDAADAMFDELGPKEQARRRALISEVQRNVDARKAEFAARGEPWPASDHSDMYDEWGLPK